MGIKSRSMEGENHKNVENLIVFKRNYMQKIKNMAIKYFFLDYRQK